MAGKAKRVTGVRWDPLFIRWCLNLSRVSPKAYEIMRESGISLPTRRTLSDYTHWMSEGFQAKLMSFYRLKRKWRSWKTGKSTYVAIFACFFIFHFVSVFIHG